MYAIDGDFGKVRHIPIPMGFQNLQTELPFRIASGGWHQCNEKYRFHRENGLNTHLLFFSVSAGGRICFDHKQEIELPACSAAWIPPDIPHSYFTAPGNLWEFYWLHLKASPALQLREIFRDNYRLPIFNIERITSEIESMLHSRYKTSLEFQFESSRRFSNIYHYLLQESSLQKIAAIKGDSLVHDIINDMEVACHLDWNLPLLSQKYYLSVPQLIRRFRAETGMTPYAYLMCIRLQTAEMYLRHTPMTVEEISRKTGFSSTSNFILQFRKIYGSTPQKYRSQ